MLHDGSTMVLKDVDKHTEGVSQEVNFNMASEGKTTPWEVTKKKTSPSKYATLNDDFIWEI